MKKIDIAFIFPGQGAQYPKMGKDFYDHYAIARQTFQEADDVLKRNLTKVIFEGSEADLAETKNSQLAIYTMSIALLRVINNHYPTLIPKAVAGLSLGEYTALTASNKLSFADGLFLVNHRSQFMNEVCETTQGTMACVLGLNAEDVEAIATQMNDRDNLCVANYNCPGQVVISGTMKGIEWGSAAAKLKGAKRVLPLRVHGAFHSDLMARAEKNLKPYIERVPLYDSPIQLYMNVPGSAITDVELIRQYLIDQVTHSVRWEQSIRQMCKDNIRVFIEIGCGKTLVGFNKRIDDTLKTISIEHVTDLTNIEGIL